MASNVRDVPTGDLTTEQVTLLVRQLTAMHAELSEVLAMMGRYAAAGGRDYETWDRILDGIGRSATRLMQYSGDPIHPDWQAAAVQAIAAAAGATVKDGALPEATHRTLAQAVLVTVWRSGAHFLISPDDWPDLLPEVVLGAVRRAPLVNGDPLMRDLRGEGQG
ncbi:hypothetical protein QTQ03_29455 [Micromonospora sp. WMMA1363]|uniref:hypothetical protein n=1 Tax=Micromonospora sp. WMMA1363 TaxID=3053985 RepID=UPI00259C859B|nr:hypothetical protein [Micromonospora sp. WMMA1363]MDM4723506.1 hypothetical protein [Micromonospora sp. WMMA1363]